MNKNQRVPVIIDTDPGIDDAIALLLALASPELKILGITTVAGNIPQPLAFSNAHKILKLANARIDVYSGAEKPLVKELVTAERVNGELGLGFYQDNQINPEPSAVHGVDFIIEQCRLHIDDPLTLCTLGPLTNIALALQKAPDIVEGIDKLVMMGGALKVKGNVTGKAEFNIFVDPHAADAVLRSTIPVVMHSLDVTNQTIAPGHWIDSFKQKESTLDQAICQMLSYSRKTDYTKMHDACVIAWLIQPDLFDMAFCSVTVETEQEAALGKTTASFDDNRTANVQAAFGIDSKAFYHLLSERLESLKH